MINARDTHYRRFCESVNNASEALRDAAGAGFAGVIVARMLTISPVRETPPRTAARAERTA